MDMKVQGSRSGKALGIAELLTSYAGSIIDVIPPAIIRRRKARAAVLLKHTDHKNMPGS